MGDGPKPKLSAMALASVTVAVLYPLLLLWTADFDYLATPWEETPEISYLVWLPLLAVVCGHVARWQIARGTVQGPRVAAIGLLIGYLGIAAFPAIAVLEKPSCPIYESSAVGSMRTLHISLSSYARAHPEEGFPADLRRLAEASEDDWQIDPSLGSGAKSGYRFTYAARSSKGDGVRDSFEVFASPMRPNNPYTTRYFFVDETGVIRAQLRGVANARSQTLEQAMRFAR